MSMSSNHPPQLQLSLGLPPPHHAFKRSFHQFGLDVDDAEDPSENSTGSTSSAGSSSASSGGSSGSRSVSSGSSYSVQSGDVYNHGERGERNKRARSEGPENANTNTNTNMNINARSDGPSHAYPARYSASALPSSSGAQQHERPVQAPSEYEDYLTTPSAGSTYTDSPAWTAAQSSSATLPMPSFAPPTPSIADFAASRASISTHERPPGFSGMLSPRLSSPAPPPAVDLDIMMNDADDVGAAQRSFASRRHDRGLESDSRLEAATDNLRSSLARAREFDRRLAPLRSDNPAWQRLRDQGQEAPRPRLPPFDFESHRRRPSPAMSLTMPFGDANSNGNTSQNAGAPSSFDQDHNHSFATENANTSYLPRSVHSSSSSTSNISSAPASGASFGNSAGAGSSFFADARVSSMNANTRRNRNPSPEPMRFSLPLALDDDEDDIDDELDDIDRELDGEGASSHVETAPLNESSGRQSSTSANENSSAGIRGQTSLLRDRVVSLLGEMDSGSLSASDFEDEPIGRARGDSSPARRHSSFLSSRQGLRPSRSPVGEAATDSSRRAGSAQSSASGFQLPPPFASSSLFSRVGSTAHNSGSSSAAVRHPVSHPNPRLERMMNRSQGHAEQTGLGGDRISTWPWSPLPLPDREERAGAGSGVGPPSAPAPAPARGAPLHEFSAPQSAASPSFSLSGPGSAEGEFESERIGRMVRLDMEMDVRPQTHTHVHNHNHNHNHMHTHSHITQNRTLPSPPPQRLSLPVLRSSMYGSESLIGSAGVVADTLREERQHREERDAERNAANANASAISPSMSVVGLRSRGMRMDSRTMSMLEFERSGSYAQHQTQYRREEQMPYVERRQEAAERSPPSPLSQLMDLPPITIADLHRPGPNGRSIMDNEEIRNATSSLMSSLMNLQSQDRERDREIERDRSREWERERERERTNVPSVPTERPRLSELRELNRLPIRPRSYYERRSEMTTTRQRPFNTDTPAPPRNWRPIYDSDPPANAQTVQRYLAQESEGSASASNATTSSTEAAAFFASAPYGSGPGSGPARHANAHTSPALLRQRRLRLLSGLAESTQSRARSDSPTLFSPDESLDPLPGLSYNLVRDTRRSPSPSALPARSSTSPGRDLLQLLYPNRFSADADVQSLQHPAESVDTAASSARTPEDFDFHDLPSLDDSRPRIWGWRPEQEVGNGTGQTQRNATARSASRPPSLPPLRFDHLPSIAPEREMESAESRLFGSEDSTAHVAPWRRGAARQDTPTYESAWTRRSTQRNEIALQRAMLLQSVQARQTQAHDAEREPAAAATGRSHGFHHAMNVLGSDGLSSTRRQQFTSAYDRERERPQPPRIDTHVRWGDIADEDVEARPSGHSFMDSFRRRRTVAPALFAPPPENADNAHPNRGRGTGAGIGRQGSGETLPPAASSMHDWFAMISAGRQRARQRARTGRHDEDGPTRSFSLRLGRRPNLRNLGDFMRDEDFDTSYESLIALAATLGDAKPRATPAHIISALPTGLYKDWQTAESDSRCPICLDDYKDVDPVLKAEPCNHWCHKECLEQWLHSARTCPVCRTKINSSQRLPTPPPVAGPSRIDRATDSVDGTDDSDDDLSSFNPSPILPFSPGSIDSSFFDAMTSDYPRAHPP